MDGLGVDVFKIMSQDNEFGYVELRRVIFPKEWIGELIKFKVELSRPDDDDDFDFSDNGEDEDMTDEDDE